MRAELRLNRRIAVTGEAQRFELRRARDVGRLGRLQCRAAAAQSQNTFTASARRAGSTCMPFLQVFDLALLPTLPPTVVQPANAQQNVDRADISLGGEGGLAAVDDSCPPV